VGKGHGRVNMVQTLCTHVCKWKNEIIPGMGGKEKNGGGSEFEYDTL
jgi:hypothetical protein